MDRRLFLAGAVAASVPGVARASLRPPGGTVGVVATRDGIAGFVAEGEGGALLDPSLRWHIGSNTKAMTAALYGRMVDRGRCRWNVTVPGLFPAIPSHPAWAQVRVEDLLGHVSGLTDDLVDDDWLEARRADPGSARGQRRALVAAVLAAPPRGRPGEYRYGNLNFVLVGAAIEEAFGMGWEDAMRAELFAPLGMADAGFGAPSRSAPWGSYVEDGILQAVDPSGVADNPAVLWPSGGVHVTPLTYAGFLGAIVRGGPPLLRPDTLARLLRPARSGHTYAGGWSLEGPAADPAATLAHNGSNSFWFAAALVDRRRGRGYAAMTNCGGARGEAAASRLLRSLRPGVGAGPEAAVGGLDRQRPGATAPLARTAG